MTNSRNKGASFEREIANLLNEDLQLENSLKRILEQTREKFLPDLILGRLYIECKRYGSGAEPLESWWQQVLEASEGRGIPVLVYKFNRRPIKVKLPLWAVNPSFDEDSSITTELLWKDFIYVIKELYQEDIEANEQS
ncbi:MAG: hypothetical protein ACJ0F4_00215 [Gammaproteobacteria bacterium]